jgi:uncharacterized protein (UPF0147 family)
MPKKILLQYDSRETNQMRQYLHTVFAKHSVPREINGEKALWQAVVVQAVMDILSNAKCPKVRRAKKQALNWLKKSNEDFLMVCSFAGFDPDFVIRGMKRALYRTNKQISQNERKQETKGQSDSLEGQTINIVNSK